MKKLNKKTIIIIASVLVVVLVAITVFILNPFAKTSQEGNMKKKLEEMGAEFYEDFYYKQIESLGDEKANFLKKYETIGIKVDLGNLSRYKGQDSEEVLKEFVNKETKEACDKDKTQVTIYPQDPYDKKSYKLEVKLVCGFEKDEEEAKEQTKNDTSDTKNDQEQKEDEKEQ